MPDTLLAVEQLSIAFGQKEVVRNVSFSLEKGRTVALVGESGSGKSLTSSAIMGLLPPRGKMTTGTIRNLTNDEVWMAPGQSSTAPLGRGLSMVFQDPMSSLNPSMKVGWQVAEPLIFHRGFSKAAARDKTIELLHEVELPTPEKLFLRYPHELSGGQKQRVMIAMALAANPELLIADEPTTALDVTVQKAILNLLKRIQETRNLAILFITHDLDVVRDIADQVLVMQDGQLVEQGEANSVLQNPQHPYTLALIEARKHAARPFGCDAEDILVRAQGLTKSYPTEWNMWGKPTSYFHAVQDTTLTISRGERVGLIGESGSGKSTLGRMLIGMLSASSGNAQIAGWDVADLAHRKSVKKAAQLVFQDPYSALNPRLTIGSALMEVFETQGVAKSEAQSRSMKLLKEVGLKPEDFERRPDSFSGGQRQRIVIARALAMEPVFLVLDESVAALDVQIQRDILDLLARIGDERKLTFLFISHDLSVIASFCNRLLIMHQGRIIEEGKTAEIMNRPKESYTAELLSSRPGQHSWTTASN